MQFPLEFIAQIESKINDVESFMAALDESPPVSIRLNPDKQIPAFDEFEQVPWHVHGRYLPERPVFTLDPLFHAGAYYVQEASSMFLHELLQQCMDLSKSWSVLDLCAAPGGKSTLLASAFSADSFILANEVIKKRIEPLRHNLTKWGQPNVMISNHDPEDFTELAGFFDLVCVDAPCSGEGLFRKNIKAVGEWSPNVVKHCSARQRRILLQAKDLVSPGGFLVYSTCTFNEMENDHNLEWLCQQGEFEAVTVDIPQDWGIIKTTFGYQFFPHRLKGEGFFVSIIKKQGTHVPRSFHNKMIRDLSPLSNQEKTLLSPWFAQPGQISFFRKPNQEIIALPKETEDCFTEVARALKRRSSGWPVGTIKGNQFLPSHALALSKMIHPDCPALDLNLDQALRFLKKDDFGLTMNSKGWHLIRYEGYNLGWVKLIGHRFNNYLPNDWRIRMSL